MTPRQYENDEDVGVSVIDSYTHFVLEYLEGINKTSMTSMKDLVGVTTTLGSRFVADT
jgi:glycosylphosphatidylinositol transamidase (GPIT) subunit GPI8